MEEDLYYILVEYPGDKKVHVVHAGDDGKKVLQARGENVEHLYTIGYSLLADGLIVNFRIVKEMK